MFEPLAGKRRRQTQEHDRQRKDPAERGQRPVVSGGLRNADDLGQRTVEYGEGVRLADTKVNGERAGGTIQREKPGFATVACLEKNGAEPEFPLGSVILLMVGLR
jgi:hypothetical protein